MQIYYPMLTFTVGEVFPVENPYDDRSEGPMLATHSDGITLILYSDDVQSDLETWATATLGLALTAFDNIPFVVLTFLDSPLTLLYTLNMFRMIGDERGPWLRSLGTTVNLALIDNQNGRLACIRTVETKLLAALRHICREQLKEYADGEQTEKQIYTLLDPPHKSGALPVTAKRVLERAKLSNQFVVQYATAKPAEQ